jgi:type I site-specific restriction endonuclease
MPNGKQKLELTSCFHYSSSLDDLVLFMDESHHYRAERGMEVINELNPILGLELTATPQVERAGSAIKFKNVVYEYSLAKAIRDASGADHRTRAAAALRQAYRHCEG